MTQGVDRHFEAMRVKKINKKAEARKSEGTAPARSYHAKCGTEEDMLRPEQPPESSEEDEVAPASHVLLDAVPR
eukprot:3401182-Rhodomonas_salina.1